MPQKVIILVLTEVFTRMQQKVEDVPGILSNTRHSLQFGVDSFLFINLNKYWLPFLRALVHGQSCVQRIRRWATNPTTTNIR